PVTVVIATAGRSQRREWPANVKAAEFLPGDAAARRAALVICNGGSGTAYQALAAGTPVIGLPSNLDQYLTMSAVVAHEAGIAIPADSLRVDRLRDAAQRVLDAGACA